MAISFQTSMACLFQSKTIGCAIRSIQYFKELEYIIIKVDERLKHWEESNCPLPVDVGRLRSYREEVLKSYIIKVRYVLDKLTSPSTLLDMAVLAVLSYDLPIDELPEEMKILLQEGSIQAQAQKLKDEIEILKDARTFIEFLKSVFMPELDMMIII